MIETVLASVAALLIALATVPGLVLFAGWTLLVAFLTWSWAMHKAATAPEWFAKRNAQRAQLESGARAFWQRLADKFEKAKEG